MRLWHFLTTLLLCSLLLACGGSHTNEADIPIKASAPAPADPSSIFKGSYTNYFVRKTRDGIEVIDMSSTGARTLLPLETSSIQFDDLRLRFDMNAKAQALPPRTLDTLIELYIAYFNRVPDADGLAYWMDQYQAGMSLDHISLSFFNAALQFSDLTGYSANMSDLDFVKIIYKNVLGREVPDEEGLQYWHKQLSDHSLSRVSLIRAMLTSAHTFHADPVYGWVSNLLDDKIMVGNYYAISKGLSFIDPKEAIKQGVAIGAMITPKVFRENIFKEIDKIASKYSVPIADAFAVSTALVGTSIVLDGSPSFQTEGLPLEYQWSIIQKPANSLASISNAHAVKASFAADVPGQYQIQLQVTANHIPSIANNVQVSFESQLPQESTLVIRTVGTGPTWGQEPVPAWQGAAPVKSAAGYKLIDLELGRGSDNQLAYTGLYFFDALEKNMSNDPLKWKSYKSASTVAYADITGSNKSAALRDTLIAMFSTLFTKENPSRIVLAYSGHGGPTSFFEGMLSTADAQAVLAHLKKLAGNRPVILDFSTNCNTGYFDFVVNYYRYADYLIASELVVGGFMPLNVDYWLKNHHDRNLHNFWQTTHSLPTAFQAILSARKNVWAGSAADLLARNHMQSLSTYDLTQFRAFMQTLTPQSGFDASRDLPSYANNLGTYALRANKAEVKLQFEKFRFGYVADNDIVKWDKDLNGFAVMSNSKLSQFLHSSF